MNKSHKETHENTNKWKKGVNKPVQNLKLQIETINKTQTEGNLEMKIVGSQTRTLEESITDRKQQMEERMSGTEVMKEEMDPLSMKILNVQNTGQKIFRISRNTKKRTNLRRGREEGQETRVKDTEAFSTKSQKNFPDENCKSMNMNNNINKMKDAEIAFDKLQHPLMIQSPGDVRNTAIPINIKKAVCSKPIVNINSNGEKLKAVPLKS